MTLVRNNINACLVDTHMEDSEYQVLEIKADASDIQLVNFYCPTDNPLSLDTISTDVSNFILKWATLTDTHRSGDISTWIEKVKK